MNGFWEWAGEHWFITGVCAYVLCVGASHAMSNIGRRETVERKPEERKPEETK